MEELLDDFDILCIDMEELEDMWVGFSLALGDDFPVGLDEGSWAGPLIGFCGIRKHWRQHSDFQEQENWNMHEWVYRLTIVGDGVVPPPVGLCRRKKFQSVDLVPAKYFWQ